MANTLVQYCSFYMVAFLFGMGLCLPEHLVILKYNSKIYVARGSLSGGQWNLAANGQPDPTTQEMSVVVLSLCETFEATNGKKVSIGFDGTYTGQTFDKGSFNPFTTDITIIPNIVGNLEANAQTFEQLRDILLKSAHLERPTFTLQQISTQTFQEGIRIVCGISFGNNGKSEPDVKLVSDNASKIELIGYRRDINFRFVGEQAQTCIAALGSGNLSWNLNGTSGSPLTLIDLFSQWTIDGQLIVDVNLDTSKHQF